MKHLIICILILLSLSGFSQTISLRVIPTNLWYSEVNGGTQNDCGGWPYPSDSKPDPRWRTSTVISGHSTNAWYDIDRTNFNVGWTNSVTPSGSAAKQFIANNINPATTITTQFWGWEEDGAGGVGSGSNCGAPDDNQTSSGLVNIATYNVQSYPPNVCNTIETVINGYTSPQGNGGIFKMQWGLIWYYNSILPGSISGDQTLCDGIPSLLSSTTSASTGASYQWQVSSNGGTSWADIVGASNFTYLPPANPSMTLKYRRKAYCGGVVTSCYGYSFSTPYLEVFSNIVTVTATGSPTNNMCANATLISMIANSVSSISYNTCGATTDGTVSCATNVSNNPNIWYKVSVPASGTVSFSLTNTNYNNARLTVYAGNNCNSLQEKGCAYKSNVDPSITLSSCNAMEYYISVGGVNSTGTGVLVIDYQPVSPLLSGSIGGSIVYCGTNNPPIFSVITPSLGGIGTYTYQWQINPTNLGFWVDMPNEVGELYDPNNIVVSSQYRRKVTDVCGTTAYSNIVDITINPKPTLSLANITNVNCAGKATGSMQFTSSLLTNATYELSQGGSIIKTNSTGLFTVLTAGQYSAVVKDATDCSSEPYLVQITEKTPLVPLCFEIAPVTCNGFDYTIVADATGGTPPYQYSIDGLTYQTSNSLCFDINTGTSGTVFIKDANGCDTSKTFSITGLRASSPASVIVTERTSTVEEVIETPIEVYPNPTTGELTLLLKDRKVQKAKVQVMNEMGQVVMEEEIGFFAGEKEQQMDISRLPSGIYFLHFVTDSYKVTKKVIKE